MSTQELVDKFNQLPPAKKQEIEELIDSILFEKELEAYKKGEGRGSMAGFLKGKIWMSDDFDEPLDDFKDYM